MPPGQESTLQHQDCRDIAFYISNLPRPAGDRQGPVVALQQQLLMRVLPPLLRLTESSPSKSAAPAAETRAQPVLGHAE